MSMKLYVGNLAFQTTKEQLQDYFGQYGQVEDAMVASDRDTGRSRGFGFITFSEKEAGDAAVEGTNGKDFMGRNLVVNEARPFEKRPGGGGGGFGGGGGDRGGNRERGGYGGGGGGGRDRGGYGGGGGSDRGNRGGGGYDGGGGGNDRW